MPKKPKNHPKGLFKKKPRSSDEDEDEDYDIRERHSSTSESHATAPKPTPFQSSKAGASETFQYQLWNFSNGTDISLQNSPPIKPRLLS